MERRCGNATTLRSAGLTGIIPKLSVMSLVMERALLPTRQFLLGGRRCILPSWRKAWEASIKGCWSTSSQYLAWRNWKGDKAIVLTKDGCMISSQEPKKDSLRIDDHSTAKCIWFVCTHKATVRLLCRCSCVFIKVVIYFYRVCHKARKFHQQNLFFSQGKTVPKAKVRLSLVINHFMPADSLPVSTSKSSLFIRMLVCARNTNKSYHPPKRGEMGNWCKMILFLHTIQKQLHYCPIALTISLPYLDHFLT